MELNFTLQDWKNDNINLSKSDKHHILTSQYIIKVSRLNMETFTKVCDINGIKYPSLRDIQNQGRSFPDIVACFKRYELQNKLVEKFKSCFDKLATYNKPIIITLFNTNFQLIKQHINFVPYLIDEYIYAIMITNIHSLSKFIDGDD